MKILLTGGAGFIGSHVAERLVCDGHQLVIVDELNDFYSPDLKRANLDEILEKGPYEFIQADICDAERMYEVVASTQPDAVIHLAARAGVRPSVLHPLLYERVNVYGTLALLEACRRQGVRKFILGSSSSVYGVANRVPFSEDDTHNLPISPYAATKLGAEKICYTYSHLYGMNVVCLRFFTVYGPRQRPDLAIRKFTEMIDSDKPIPFYGDGSSGRDYTFCDDTVQGIVASLSYDAGYDIINLGNSHPVTLSEMVSTIEGCLGKRAIIERHPDQPGDVPVTFADISKARRLLGYAPQTPFKEGVERFVEWYRRQCVGPGLRKWQTP